MDKKSKKLFCLPSCSDLAHACLWLVIDFPCRTAKAQSSLHQATIVKSPVYTGTVYHSDKSPGRCVFCHVEKSSWPRHKMWHLFIYLFIFTFFAKNSKFKFKM